MAPRVTRKVELVVSLLVFLIFLFVVGKYVGYRNVLNKAEGIVVLFQEKFFRDKTICSDDQVSIKLSDGTICRNHASDSEWLNIYDTYPKFSQGQEVIYKFLDESNADIADKYLEDYHSVDRFEPIKLENITWTEDPHQNRYWRFIFYSLRSVHNLLAATEETGDQKYDKKAIEIVDSFLTSGMDKEHSWDDYHAVAFRTMMLIDVWWKLRAQNLLTAEMSEKLLKALEVHGDFLYDYNHYQPQHNHGTNEAAALFLLGTNFPSLKNADQWLEKSKERLGMGIEELVDEDGALIENSPYYHFYTLEKYWEIYKYSKRHEQLISPVFDQKIEKMISYATYVLQPNLHVPLLGASLDREIRLSGQYQEMAKSYPYLNYVLSMGREGKRPDHLNTLYPTTGEAILRSGWGDGDNFKDQTQIIFDAGPYRTSHSDLDALSFNLYGAGLTLMPDAGLYQYEDGEYRSYFHGTSAHNTVVVDGKDQRAGDAVIGSLIEGDGYAYSSGEHKLYDGVTHRRSIALLGEKLILIIDHLDSDKNHEYKQNFHLFPEAKVNVNELTVSATGQIENQSVTIRQIEMDGINLSMSNGEESPVNGFCSIKYEKKIPCYAVSYKKTAAKGSFVTLLEIGKPDKQLQFSMTGGVVDIQSSEATYHISISETEDIKGGISVEKKDDPLPISKFTINNFDNSSNWHLSSGASANTNFSIVDDNSIGAGLVISSSSDGKYSAVERDLPRSLSDKNLLFRIKIPDFSLVSRLDVSISSNSWSGYATNDLKNAYKQEDSDGWINVSLGKGEYRENGGQWRFYGDGFDWGNVDKIRFGIASKSGSVASLEVNDLSLTEEQKIGSVVIIFDDGFESILPAVEIMNQYGFKGNIAAIKNYAATHFQGYLSTLQLKKLQDEYGWNIVNHSSLHKDAISEYYEKHDLEGLEADIVSGAKYLAENSINSAPNWYVYPHGLTNEAVKGIVGKYYKFARTTRNQPEVFPFGEPLGVKAFSSDGSISESGYDDPLDPEQLLKAVKDSKKFKLTLFLTFHRIEATLSDKPGYKIDDFKRVVEGIASESIPVKTLHQLDIDNEVNETGIKFTKSIPSQIQLNIESKKKSVLEKVYEYGKN